MLKTLKKKLDGYYKNDSDNPFFLGFICGFFSLVFYFSNNFFAINSLKHLTFIGSLFLGIPILYFVLLQLFFKYNPKFLKYKKHVLFVSLIFCCAVLLTYVMFLIIKKKILLCILIVSILLSLKLFREYKKVVVLIIVMTIIPMFKVFNHLIESIVNGQYNFNDIEILNTKLKKTPNIYLIQPDGYVAESMMKSNIYQHNSDLYDWLRKNEFKIYDRFRSNYPASLTSNSSMFLMKQHLFGKTLFPSIEMPNAREIICGDNPVKTILTNNNYKTHFIVQDDYFQQNYSEMKYDYSNISNNEIPMFTDGNKIKKVVFEDLLDVINKNTSSNFYFIEKLLPHHVHFSAPEDRVETERKLYIKKIEEVNVWLKETISYISEVDNEAIIIVLADHGGWVGMVDYNEMFQTQDKAKIESIFSTLAAIKWNGIDPKGYDLDLISNVNLFRVLFSVLSENKQHLDHMEDDSSYNIHVENYFYNSVYQVINDKGEFVFIKK